MTCRSEHRARGFSLLELVVSLALTSLVILIGLQLVAESTTLFRDVDRAVKSSSVTLAVASIRRDAHSAAAALVVPVVPGEPVPLELRYWNGARVLLTLEGTALVRYYRSADGATTGRRVLLRGVTSWWWSYANGSTIEIRITVLNYSDPRPSRRQSVERRTEARVFALRGSPDGRRW